MTKNQMQKAVIEKLTDAAPELGRLRAEIARLREALEWYADIQGYSDRYPRCSVEVDAGKRAREALGR